MVSERVRLSRHFFWERRFFIVSKQKNRQKIQKIDIYNIHKLYTKKWWLSIYIHENYSFKQMEMIDSSPYFENICVELKCKKKNLYFINSFHLWTNLLFSICPQNRTFAVILTYIYCKFKRMTVMVNFMIT